MSQKATKCVALCNQKLSFASGGANPRATDDGGKDCQDLVAAIKDDKARTELTALCKTKKEQYGCFVILGERSGNTILYLLEEDMVVHISKTCAVIRVTIPKTEPPRRLVLKFMHERSQYDTEVAVRRLHGHGGVGRARPPLGGAPA